jgi:hypothetical protein
MTLWPVKLFTKVNSINDLLRIENGCMGLFALVARYYNDGEHTPRQLAADSLVDRLTRCCIRCQQYPLLGKRQAAIKAESG